MATAVYLHGSLSVGFKRSLLWVAPYDFFEPLWADFAGGLHLASGIQRVMEALSDDDFPRLRKRGIVDEESVIGFQVAEHLVWKIEKHRLSEGRVEEKNAELYDSAGDVKQFDDAAPILYDLYLIAKDLRLLRRVGKLNSSWGPGKQIDGGRFDFKCLNVGLQCDFAWLFSSVLKDDLSSFLCLNFGKSEIESWGECDEWLRLKCVNGNFKSEVIVALDLNSVMVVVDDLSFKLEHEPKE